MSLTYTAEISLGYDAPTFQLLDTVSGSTLSLSDVRGDKGLVVMFICNHCPYVVHVREELVRLANAYIDKGVGFVAISSNDVVNYPEDGPEEMKDLANRLDFPFPYLYDEDQSVAKAYKAACTPDFSVFDSELTCVYRGRLDDSSPGNGVPLTGNDLRRALDQLLGEGSVTMQQLPSMGCNIKWK
ncbi:MAG: thioredoxin family protein [Cryomorphaceae bacterium]